MPLGTRRRRGEGAAETGEADAPETARPARLRAVGEWLAVGRRKWVALGLAVAIAAAGGVGIGLLLLSAVFDEDEKPRQRAPTWVRFRDERVGFSLAHPAGWERLQSDDAQVGLIAAQRGGPGSLLVRVFPLPFEVNRTTLGVAKALAEKAVSSRRKGKPPRPRDMRLGGLPAVLYLYSFRDADTGQRGVHLHYFAFEGRSMIGVVLQALPANGFKRLVPVFAQIEASFRDEAP